MSNLLDKASIILTPTAYKNNEALCVKPSDGSGDFDFSRNSAATRVNAQGLVENVQILSSNLVQNGDFSEEGAEEITNGDFSSDTAWVKGTGWTISGGSLNASAATATAFQQNTGIVTNKTYKVTYTISNYVSGSVRIEIGSANVSVGLVRSADGTYTEYITALGDDEVYFDGISAFTGSIDNVSVREVGQNWVIRNAWSIEAQGVRGVNASVQTDFYQLNVLPNIGKSYKYSFEILEITSGSIELDFNNAETSQTYNTIGVHTGILNSTGGNGAITFRGVSLFSGLISNVSIIEITTETSLPRINYEGFSYQDALGSELVTNGDFATDSDWVKIGNVVIASGKATYTAGVATRITQNVGFVAQKKYLVTFDVLDYVSGNVVIGSNGGYLGIQRSANGTYSEVIEWSGNSTIYIYSVSNNFTGSIDNVSVKEYLGQEVVPDSGCGHYLFEPASRNLIPYSSDLSDSSWKKQNGGGTTFIPSVTANYGISPDGTQNASRVIFDLNGGTTSSDFSQLQNNITATVGNNYTSSVYMKSNDSNSYNVTLVNVNGGTNIVSVTPQWQRFSISAVLSAANMRIRTRGSENSSDVTDVLIWGAQLEEQSYSTSYIPTENNPNGVSRNRDLCTNGGSLASINSTEGVLYAEIAALSNDGTKRYISLSDGSNNNDVRLYFDTNGYISVLSKVGGSTQVFLQSNAYTQTDFNKVAFKYKENDFALWINGVEVGTDILGSVNAANTLNELAFFGNNLPFFGKTKALAVWKEALSDSELQSLTTI